MKKYTMLLIGFIFCALTFGFLVGQSQSPVLGVTITGIIGVIGTLATTFSKKPDRELTYYDKVHNKNKNYNILGLFLFCSSVFLLLGTFLGSFYRSELINLSRTKELPWTDKNQPRSSFEAVDWLLVQDNLLNRGYSNEQIKYLYSLNHRDTASAQMSLIKESSYYYFITGNPKDDQKNYSVSLDLPIVRQYLTQLERSK